MARQELKLLSILTHASRVAENSPNKDESKPVAAIFNIKDYPASLSRSGAGLVVTNEI